MSGPQRFRKKPVVVEAMQFRGSWSSWLGILRWAPGIYFVPTGYEHELRHDSDLVADEAPAFIVIPTLEGDMRADRGDWIIRGIKGEFYPCKPDIFEATYEAATDE